MTVYSYVDFVDIITVSCHLSSLSLFFLCSPLSPLSLSSLILLSPLPLPSPSPLSHPYSLSLTLSPSPSPSLSLYPSPSPSPFLSFPLPSSPSPFLSLFLALSLGHKAEGGDPESVWCFGQQGQWVCRIHWQGYWRNAEGLSQTFWNGIQKGQQNLMLGPCI